MGARDPSLPFYVRPTEDLSISETANLPPAQRKIYADLWNV